MTTTTLPTVTPDQLARQLADGSTAVLDVRTPGEYAAGAIEGSQLLPLDQLGDHLDDLASGLTGPVAIVCRSGQRSGQAYRQLSEAGAQGLTVLDGGLNAWQQAGQPVASAGAKKWDMERQVRFTAGSLVLAGVLASLRFPKARFLSGAVGGGLTFAALSNTCAMGNVLGRLPYNRTGRADAKQAVSALTRRAA